MSKIIILSPSSSGKTYFMNKNNFLFNGKKLVCNEFLSSHNNTYGDFRMGSTAALVPSGHEYYKSWDDIYKIGVKLFLNSDKYNDSVLIYNSSYHIKYLKENYPDVDLRVVLINEEKHREKFLDKWESINDTKKSLIDLIKSDSNLLRINGLASMWFLMEERKIYKRLTDKYNISIYDSFEKALNKK
jgi:hypothetical protein